MLNFRMRLCSFRIWVSSVSLDSAGELSEEEIEKIKTIMANPRQFDIPDWFLNRQKDPKDGKFGQVSAATIFFVHTDVAALAGPWLFGT